MTDLLPQLERGLATTCVTTKPKVKNKDGQYYECCDLCSIKFGTIFLGLIEAVIALFILISALQQISNRNHFCQMHSLKECLSQQLQHFDIRLLFDYVVVIMMICILASIILLFFGLLSDTSCLVLPHIIIQGVFLIFSVGYFLLYAWSYFYGDLIEEKKPFLFQSLIERMWLATLLLVLAALQCYLFKSVIRCSKYLATIEVENRRRESEFERVSEKVRKAKQNGLWRTTSWGGGIEEYKGQYDKKEKKKTNKGFHVQWGKLKVENDEKGETEEISILSIGSSAPKLQDIAERFMRKEKKAKIEEELQMPNPQEPSTSCTNQNPKMIVSSEVSVDRRFHSESPRKEKAKMFRKAESDCGPSSSSGLGKNHQVQQEPHRKNSQSSNVLIEVKLPNSSQANAQNRRKHSRSNERDIIEIRERTDHEKKRRTSITEDKSGQMQKVPHRTSRRRSSVEDMPIGGVSIQTSTNSSNSQNHNQYHHRGSRHHENMFVKKVSITTNI